MADKTYEMLWDCRFCGTSGLLALTHRHCPNCGAAQDAAERYFPPDDEKVAVEDHVYAGADRNCPACDSPNSAAATFCGNCGSPMDAAAAVARKDEQVVGQDPAAVEVEPPAPARKGGGSKVALAIFAVALLAIACGVASLFFTAEQRFEVAGHQWERTIDVERYDMVREEAWRDRLPAAAADVQCRSKKRDTKRVEDGETCKTVNVDLGDGTFRQDERCKPKYRSVDVMDDWCGYRVPKWQRVRTATAQGQGLDAAPHWPEVQVSGCASLGCERQGPRKEDYTVVLRGEDGEQATCSFNTVAAWQGYAPGSTWTADVRRVTGGVVCGSLRK